MITAVLSPMQKAAANPKSKTLAIAAHCYHICRGETDTNSHTAKLEIKNCPDKLCPLWNHRGWQKITGGNVKNPHVKKMALKPKQKQA